VWIVRAGIYIKLQLMCPVHGPLAVAVGDVCVWHSQPFSNLSCYLVRGLVARNSYVGFQPRKDVLVGGLLQCSPAQPEEHGVPVARHSLGQKTMSCSW